MDREEAQTTAEVIEGAGASGPAILAPDIALGLQREFPSFRHWPYWAMFAPVLGRAIWRGLQHGDLSLAANTNPLMRDDGAISASKSKVFSFLPPELRRWMPSFVAVRKGASEVTARILSQALSEMEGAGLHFSIVAKPDRGTAGRGVRLVRDERELREYIAAFPPDQVLLLQEKIAHRYEAGIMYMRRPAEPRGRIVSLAVKEPAGVTGDGASTLGRLIERHPHAGLLRRRVMSRDPSLLDRVPARGERVELVFGRNRCTGAVCRNRPDLITPELTEAHRRDRQEPSRSPSQPVRRLFRERGQPARRPRLQHPRDQLRHQRTPACLGPGA